MTEKQRGFFEGERIDNFVDGAFAFVVTLLVTNRVTIAHDLIGALTNPCRCDLADKLQT
ncbi:MAG: hypothetical protein WCD36_09400 [Rhodanobacteraceae bacterium]